MLVFLNNSAPKLVTFVFTSKFVQAVPQKALSPKVVTLPGTLDILNLEQLRNTSAGSSVILFDNVTLVSSEQLAKQPSPRLVTELLIDTVVKLALFANA